MFKGRSLIIAGVVVVAVAAAVVAVASDAPASRPTSGADAFAGAGHTPPHSLTARHMLAAGQSLRSPDGRYVLSVTRRGQARLSEISARHDVVWRTPAVGAGAALLLRSNGDLVMSGHGKTLWTAGIRGGPGSRLTVGDGALTVANDHGTVWSSRQGNRCRHVRAPRAVLVDLSWQRAWLCSDRRQVLSTPVTTGATRRGLGTPTGSWRIYAKVRDTVLHPATGGSYHVRFWMPFDGAYGIHDSAWQRFPYGSRRYRTHGSHGCVHVPGHLMGFLFRWSSVGTTVTIHA